MQEATPTIMPNETNSPFRGKMKDHEDQRRVELNHEKEPNDGQFQEAAKDQVAESQAQETKPQEAQGAAAVGAGEFGGLQDSLDNIPHKPTGDAQALGDVPDLKDQVEALSGLSPEERAGIETITKRFEDGDMSLIRRPLSPMEMLAYAQVQAKFLDLYNTILSFNEIGTPKDTEVCPEEELAEFMKERERWTGEATHLLQSAKMMTIKALFDPVSL